MAKAGEPVGVNVKEAVCVDAKVLLDAVFSTDFSL
jgi:hypothetical protein